MINIGAETNEIGSGQTIEKISEINEIKRCFWEKIYKIDKFLARLIEERR